LENQIGSNTLSLDYLPKCEQFFFRDKNYSTNFNFRILIVDDERLIRTTLNKFISKYAEEHKLNIEICESEDCMEALNVVYTYYKKKKKFDLIITDETMPYMRGSTLINILLKLADVFLLDKYSFIKIL